MEAVEEAEEEESDPEAEAVVDEVVEDLVAAVEAAAADGMAQAEVEPSPRPDLDADAAAAETRRRGRGLLSFGDESAAEPPAAAEVPSLPIVAEGGAPIEGVVGIVTPRQQRPDQESDAMAAATRARAQGHTPIHTPLEAAAATPRRAEEAVAAAVEEEAAAEEEEAAEVPYFDIEEFEKLRAQHAARVAELRAEHEAAEAAAAEAAAEAAAPKGAVVPVDVAIDECVVRPLRECRRVLGRACVLFFVREHKLLDHLGALRTYAFGDSADFLEALALQLAAARRITAASLRRALDAALRLAGRDDDPNSQRLSLALAAEGGGGTAHGAGRRDAAEALVLNFELPAPVDLLVDGAAMDQYSRIFRFLLRLRRAALALRALWSHLQKLPLGGGGDGGGGAAHPRAAAADAATHALRLHVHDVSAFVRSIEAHCVAGVCRSCWHELRERVAAAGSAAELRAAHNDYLADATRQCFLHPAGAPTAAVVSAVFGVVAALHRDVAAAPAWRASLATSKERFRQLTHALETSEPGLVSGE